MHDAWCLPLWIKLLTSVRIKQFLTIAFIVFPRLYVLCSTRQAVANATQSVIIEMKKNKLEDTSLGGKTRYQLFSFVVFLVFLQKLTVYVEIMEARKNLSGCGFFTINNSLFLSRPSISGWVLTPQHPCKLKWITGTYHHTRFPNHQGVSSQDLGRNSLSL